MAELRREDDPRQPPAESRQGDDPAAEVSAGLYRTVLLIRRFEQRAIEMVRSGTIPGGIHPYIGEEAIAAGVCAALRPGDLITSTHRGHGHVLAKGADPVRMLAELAGRETGLNNGRGGSMHAADVSAGIYGANAIVGASAAIACGAAWSHRRAGHDGVAVPFFGDGAVNQGVFLEALNLASLRRLPVIFVCENNQFATSMRVQDTTSGTITGRARAFGIPAETIDGMDAETVLAAASGAVARARDGGGPAFLECLTYRFEPHHTWEYSVRPRYRTDEEVAAARARDPVEIQAARVPDAVRARIDGEIEELLDRARLFAEASPEPDPSGALDYLYAGGLRGRGGTA
jgi:pyruvate dehydrogenase E1 component alpha subunit